jgi:hypothetical protein
LIREKLVRFLLDVIFILFFIKNNTTSPNTNKKDLAFKTDSLSENRSKLKAKSENNFKDKTSLMKTDAIIRSNESLVASNDEIRDQTE